MANEDEFRAKIINGQLTIFPRIERIGNDVKVHMPPMGDIKEFAEKNKILLEVGK